jgi:hypothetical protein
MNRTSSTGFYIEKCNLANNQNLIFDVGKFLGKPSFYSVLFLKEGI